MFITMDSLAEFAEWLICGEKAKNTVEQYTRHVKKLIYWLDGRELDKPLLLEFKEYIRSRFKAVSVNNIISAVNTFLVFREREDLHISTLKIQRRINRDAALELTVEEYKRLQRAAKEMGDEDTSVAMMTLFSMGTRVYELKFFTVEAVEQSEVTIDCKGTIRDEYIPFDLKMELSRYAQNKGIETGIIFRSENGDPLSRSTLNRRMKRIAVRAGVDPRKVFPHNFRHLFARMFYEMFHDIVRLSEILGHSNIETTKIYTMESGDVKKRQLEDLGLAKIK